MTRSYRISLLGLFCLVTACAADTLEPTDEVVETSEEAASVADAKTPFIRGDANGDGVVDISDVSVVWNFAYSGGDVSCADAADVNDDGRVDYMDGIKLQNFLYAGGDPPAAPYPDAGLEPRYPSNDSWLCGDGSLLCDDSDDCSADHYCAEVGGGFGDLTICEADTFIRGDANDDGVVDHSDIQATWGIAYYGTEAACLDAADFNDDGRIDYMDGVGIQNYLYNGGDEPPAPMGDAGFDPTEDTLGCRH